MSRYTSAPLYRFVLSRTHETVWRRCFSTRYISATLSYVTDKRRRSGARYRFSNFPDSSRSMVVGPWIHVEGGGLPVPVELRYHRAADGRYVFTGLMVGEAGVGDEQLREITSDVLRSIKLSEIRAELFDKFDADAAFTPDNWPAITRALADANADAGGFIARPQSRQPPDDAYRAFARTYLAELGRQPQRAMSAAAAKHGISRATANRWAAICRRLGYLPPKGEA